jgi:hypothetical protein
VHIGLGGDPGVVEVVQHNGLVVAHLLRQQRGEIAVGDIAVERDFLIAKHAQREAGVGNDECCLRVFVDDRVQRPGNLHERKVLRPIPAGGTEDR